MRAAIVLAAGAGRRFGGGSKPLARRADRMLIAHAMGAARAAPVARLVVVVGHRAPRVAAAARLADRRVVIVRARAWADGPSASLAAGVSALWRIEREAFVFLADMPDVPHWLAARLLRRRRGGGSVRPVHRGAPGHPVLLGPEALRAAGQGRGGREGATILVAADRRCRFDADRRGDLTRAVPASMR